MEESRLNLLEEAAIELSDNNIVVNYKNEGTLRFKLANNLAGGQLALRLAMRQEIWQSLMVQA